MKIRINFLLALVVFLFSTCASDVYSPDVCFQENVLPIFVSNCSMKGCHNSVDKKEGFDLTSYEGIMKGISPNHPLQSEVYNVIRGRNPSMPIDKKLNQKDISYIKIWIKMGAKNTSNCSNCDSTEYSYSGRIKPIITNWCVGCHSGSGGGGGYDFSTYDGIATSIVNNKLLGALNHLPGFFFMPQNTNKLTDCDLSAFTKWVNSGYPNN